MYNRFNPLKFRKKRKVNKSLNCRKIRKDGFSQMKLLKKKRKFKIFHVFVLGLVGYTTFTLINQQIQIDKKKKELENLSEQIEIQKIKNDQISEFANSDFEDQREYVERTARSDLDLSKKGEKVFVNISGN